MTERYASRRRFLGYMAAVGALSLLQACGSAVGSFAPGSASPAAPSASVAASPSAAASAVVDPLGVEAGELDVWFVQTGYGNGYLDRAVELYNESNKETGSFVKTPVQGGAADTALQPRFVAGNPPDLILASQLPLYSLAADGQLSDLADLMSAPAFGDATTTFSDSLLSQDLSTFGGRQLAITMVTGTQGIAYDAARFEREGWEFPATWDEMLALGEEIKAKGKGAPWTYQPGYLTGSVFVPLIYRHGGYQALLDIDNLKSNAWTSDAVVAAARDVSELQRRGFILEGTTGLNHTQAQTEWLQGKAALIPGGPWFAAEMKDLIPPGVEMDMAQVPAVAGGAGKPGAALVSHQYLWLIVPSAAKKPQAAKEFIRTLMSKDLARQFAEENKVPLPVKGSADGVELPRIATSALAQIEGASEQFHTDAFTWYGGLFTAILDNFDPLIRGDATPEQFAERMQAAADAIAADPDIPKFTR